jgi:hypothetical protein
VKTTNSCVMLRFLRKISITFLAILGAPSLASSQAPSDFTVVSPEHVVDLVQVEQTPAPSNGFRFTFKNVSSKTILALCISALHGSHVEQMDCMYAFEGGTPPSPGGMVTFVFNANGFVSDQEADRSLHVNAVVYTDGSHIGAKNILDKIEDEMLGSALETKRISDLLAACPDESVTGLDSVLPQIGPHVPSMNDVAAAGELAGKVRGQSLPGIDQSYVNSHLDLHATDFLSGVANARDRAIYAANDVKTTATLQSSGSAVVSEAVAEAKSHGRADLAQRYQLLSGSQVTYLVAFKGERDARRNAH